MYLDHYTRGRLSSAISLRPVIVGWTVFTTLMRDVYQ